jgi:hypothetical protein
VEATRNPGLVERLLGACERSERATERFREAEAELAIARAEHDRHLAESNREHAEQLRCERQRWEGEEALRRKRLVAAEAELARKRGWANGALSFDVGVDDGRGGSESDGESMVRSG